MMTVELRVRDRSMARSFSALGMGGCVGIYKPQVCLWASWSVLLYEMFVTPSGKNLRTLLILERLFGVAVYYLCNLHVKVVITVSNVVNVYDTYIFFMY